MALPKRRLGKSHTRARRAKSALTVPTVPKSQKVRAEGSRSRKFFCSNCNQPKPSHAVCPNCGHYRGKAVIEVQR